MRRHTGGDRTDATGIHLSSEFQRQFEARLNEGSANEGTLESTSCLRNISALILIELPKVLERPEAVQLARTLSLCHSIQLNDELLKQWTGPEGFNPRPAILTLAKVGWLWGNDPNRETHAFIQEALFGEELLWSDPAEEVFQRLKNAIQWSVHPLQQRQQIQVVALTGHVRHHNRTTISQNAPLAILPQNDRELLDELGMPLLFGESHGP